MGEERRGEEKRREEKRREERKKKRKTKMLVNELSSFVPCIHRSNISGVLKRNEAHWLIFTNYFGGGGGERNERKKRKEKFKK